MDEIRRAKKSTQEILIETQIRLALFKLSPKKLIESKTNSVNSKLSNLLISNFFVISLQPLRINKYMNVHVFRL